MRSGVVRGCFCGNIFSILFHSPLAAGSRESARRVCSSARPGTDTRGVRVEDWVRVEDRIRVGVRVKVRVRVRFGVMARVGDRGRVRVRFGVRVRVGIRVVP